MTKPSSLRPSLKSGLIALAALAGMCVTTPAFAADSDLMDMFQRMCVKTNAAMGPALAMADRDGWQKLPEGTFSGEDFEDMTSIDARVFVEDGGFRMIFVGVGKLDTELGPTNVDLCFVGDNTSDVATVRAETQAFARLAPSKTLGEANQTIWTYVDGPTGRRDGESLSESEMKIAAQKRTMRFVLFQTEPGLVMVGYAIPRI